MDKNKCSSCGEANCSCKNKDFTRAVIEIDNPEQITLMRKVTIPASMGDDTTVPPVVGKYKNVLLYYEANQKSYLYSSDGIPTQLVNGMTDYEAATNLPQINSHTLIGDKTGEQLGLQNKLTAGDGIEIDGDNTISISDIEQYAHFFDTVADMKAAANLAAGDYARTLGFHTANDGGSGLYKIRLKTQSDVVDEMFILSTGSPTLVAELIVRKTINPESVGVYGDGSIDCTDKMQSLIEYAYNNSLIVDGSGKYLITDSITLPNVPYINLRLNYIDATAITDKPAFVLDHCRYPSITVNNIIFTKRSAIDIHNSYMHQSAFLLKSVSYGKIETKSIQNALCAFTLYSDGGSGTDGCYYNKLHCGKADVFNLVHYYNEDGAVNGNEINDTLHIVSEWNNPNNLPFYTIVNEAHTDGGTIYKNNHNVANNLMVEKYTDDGMDYLVADLTDASNFYIYVDRIEINPTLAVSDPIITTNANSQYNLVKLNTGWFTIPESNSRFGNNNFVVTFNNYKKSLNNTFYVGSGATLSNDFTAIENNICDGTITYNPAVGRVRINGIFAPTVNLSQNTDYTFCNFNTKGKTCTHGLVYLAGGGNPTAMTQIGTIRRVKDQYYCTLRINQNVSANAYLFIDFEAENDG